MKKVKIYIKITSMRGLILLLCLIAGTIQVPAFEIFLPQEKQNEVTSNYAFVVGNASAGESVSVNNIGIYTAQNGAFAYSVKLKDGENRIMIKSNYGTKIYKFLKGPLPAKKEEELREFDIKIAAVKEDNTPLRSTPAGFGMNRISALFKGTTLLINGEQGDFYRVFLSRNDTAWVAKKDVDWVESAVPAEFISTESKKYKNASVQKVSFTKNIPYTIDDRDGEVVFKIYNPEFSDMSVYTFNIQKPEKYSYKISLEDGLYTFKVSELPQKIEDCTIVIDAGHGGSEKGAIGCLGDEEKNVNLKIALELEECLKQTGANIIMTRVCDGNVSLEDRVRIAKDNNADIFVSIHLNSIGDIPMNVNTNKGTSVYYFNKNSKALAQAVENSVTKTAGTRKDGVKAASFAVIRPPDYTGILVETAYMTNPDDSVLYRLNDFAHNAAEGIAKGILEFLNK